jgi:23S rRNA (cytidine2498-2'-O)-methyltransferase
MSEASFAMICCAHGAEQSVKDSIAAEGWRLAFSRPGFVTVKKDAEGAASPGRTATRRAATNELPQGIFVRTAAWSLGSARGDRSQSLIDALVEKLNEIGGASNATPFDQLHVWPKDRVPIGRFDFEPGIDEVSRAVAEEIFGRLRERFLRCDAPNRVAESGDRVLDVVLVEPSQWFFGWHRAGDWPSRWPGGVQPIEPMHEPVSRAYYKAAEAITWSGFEMRRGDTAIEIGSAPGGACGRLLELGMKVIGIDPADMDPRIADHPNFRHIRARAGDLPRSEFRGAKWLLVDSNVKPDKTLATIENIVTNRQCSLRGLLITLKIGDYEAASQVDRWSRTIANWKPARVRVRQLARNKVEVCFAVTLNPASVPRTANRVNRERSETGPPPKRPRAPRDR